MNDPVGDAVLVLVFIVALIYTASLLYHDWMGGR